MARLLKGGRAGLALTAALMMATSAQPAAPQSSPQPPAQGSAAVAETPLDAVIRALGVAFEADANIAAGGAADPAAQEALRRSLEALVAEAEAEGESMETVARRLSFLATKRFGSDIPGAYRTDRGLLDAALLLRSVYAAPAAQARAKSGLDYLEAIQSEGAQTEVAVAVPESGASGEEGGAAATREAESDATRTLLEENGVRWIVVQQGDSLGTIAEEVYGDMLQYTRLYVANRDIISNPNLLEPGMRLRVPE